MKEGRHVLLAFAIIVYGVLVIGYLVRAQERCTARGGVLVVAGPVTCVQPR